MTPAGPGSSSEQATRPILPPTATAVPTSFKQWPISAVVVDLPLVPVITTMGACGAARKAISTSLTILMCAAAARVAAGCGVGCRCGIPGLITRASKSDHGQSCHGTTAPFGKLASGLLSSWANMVTPAASSDATAAMPELPRPRTPTV